MTLVLVAPTIEHERRAYKDFVISPSVLSASGGWFWFTLVIYRHADDGTSSPRYLESNASFPTREEAEDAAIRLGQQIIDGAIPGHFV